MTIVGALFTTMVFLCRHSSTALSASSSTAATNVRLKYFDARGAAETVRVLLALGGEDYEDTRYAITPGTFDAPAFAAAKEAGELAANLNRAPVLVVRNDNDDVVTIGQSRAMERFLARRFGLLGTSETEAALVDCVAEHCRDVRDAAQRKGFSAFARDKTDEEKAAARREWFGTDLPALLTKIEEAVRCTSGAPGCAVGSALSYADVTLWALLRDGAPADAEETTAAAVGCDTLNAVADTVAGHASVKKWLEERPVNMF